MGKSMPFNALTLEQARQLVDVRQVFEIMEAARVEQRDRFNGSMAWKRVGDREYLYRRRGRSDRSLGPRSPETEAIMEAFSLGKARSDDRTRTLRSRLEGMARVNVALGLGRVPRLVARIIRRLDIAGLGAPRTCLVGTNALFAYETAAGGHFEGGMLATGDMDLALDARRSLSITSRAPHLGLMAVLQDVDPSFRFMHRGDYRASNREGFMVELIRPADRLASRTRGIRNPDADFGTAEIWKLQWIVEAPRMTVAAIAEDGLPVQLEVPDPRYFAAHKFWLSGRGDRDPLRRARDIAQAKAVAELVGSHLPGMHLDDRSLASLPSDLRHWLQGAASQLPPFSNQW